MPQVCIDFDYFRKIWDYFRKIWLFVSCILDTMLYMRKDIFDKVF